MNDDEISTSQDTNDPNPGDQESPNFVLGEKGPQGNVEQEKGGQKLSDSNAKKKPFLAVRLWRRFHDWRRDPDSNPAEWVTVGLTAVLALVGYLQWRVYTQQRDIMNSSGQQTQQLIDAAKIQAGAAQKIADASDRNAAAAESFSTSAKEIREQTEKATLELRRSANDSEQALQASIDASRLDQRAWVGITKQAVNETIFDAEITNIGKTPAFNVATSIGTETISAEHEDRALKVRVNKGTLVPTATSHVTTDLRGQMAKRGTVRVVGCIAYDDVFRRHHWTKYCLDAARGEKGLKAFDFCSSGNETDDSTKIKTKECP